MDRLRKGDISFVLQASPERYRELAAVDPALPFYVDLRAEAQGADASVRVALLTAAWDASSGMAKREAARRLIALLDQRARKGAALSPELASRIYAVAKKYASVFPDDPDGRAVSAEALYAQGEYEKVLKLFPKNRDAATDRERAVRLVAAAAAGKENAVALAEDFFFSGAIGPYHAAAYEALRRTTPKLFQGSSRERRMGLLIQGRSAIQVKDYGPALWAFKLVLQGDESVFLGSPDLLADLGKAFQYGGGAKDGLERFEKWSGTVNDDAAKYRLLLYAGRMKRQLGDAAGANLLFARALPYAPDGAQRDACVWYLVDGAASAAPASAVPLLRKYAPYWKNPEFFSDFLGQYCATLIVKKDWQSLLETFRIVRPVADRGTVARYAYSIGRAVSLGYISADRPLEVLDRTDPSGRAPSADKGAMAANFFRIAFEADSASFYYRCLAASRLGENVDPVPAEEKVNRFLEADGKGFGSVPAGPEVSTAPENPGELARFLSAYFDYGCGAFLLDAALDASDSLSPADIRLLSRRLAEDGLYGPSLRLISVLGHRAGYRLTREDMELLYPRYYLREIGDAAKKWGVPPEQLFGLIRTESAFIPDVVSNAGATGLAQLMKPTAKDTADRMGYPDYLKYSEPKVPDLRDPATNAMLGAWYLADLNRRLERPILSFFAYNGGITRVRKWRAEQAKLPDDLFLETVPIEETRDYGRKVLAAAAVYGYLYYGKTLERVVSDIFPN